MKTQAPLFTSPLLDTPASSWRASSPEPGHDGALIEMLRDTALEVLASEESVHQSLDLNSLAHEAIQLFEDMQGSVRHPIQFEGTGSCRVRGDRERIRIMMLCLLLNASGHSAPGRAISVSVWCHGASAHLSVLDRGSGDPPPENESLFQPFRRLEAAPVLAPYSEEDDNWWLSLAAHIASAHGSDILVAGTPRLGSEVDLRLDLYQRKQSR